LFKFTIEKGLKTGLVVLIQYSQSMPWLCYALPCPISHGILPAHGTHKTESTRWHPCCKIYQTFTIFHFFRTVI